MLLTTYFLLQCTCRLSTRPDLAVVITRRLRRRPLHEQLWLRQLLQGAATGAPQTHGPTGARGRAAAAAPRAGGGRGRRAPGRATPRGPQPATRAPARRTRRALLGGPGGVARPLTAPQQPSSYRRPAMWCVHTSWSDEEAGLRQVVAGHCRPWKRRKACLRWKSLRAGHATVSVSVPVNRGCIAQAGQPEPRQGECGGGRPACGQHGAVPVRQVTVDVLPAWQCCQACGVATSG